MQHQGRCFRVSHLGDRILRGKLGRIIPVGTFQGVIKPVARIATVHSAPVKTPGMTDVSLVAVATLLFAIATVHPRHHFAAVAAAGGRQSFLIDVALLEHEVGAGLNIHMLLAAKTTIVGFQKPVTPTKRTVVIHTHHHVTLRGEDMVVPAKVEIVTPVGVWAAVDRMQQWPFLFRVKVWRIHRPHLYILTTPALDGEFAHCTQLEAVHQWRVE